MASKKKPKAETRLAWGLQFTNGVIVRSSVDRSVVEDWRDEDFGATSCQVVRVRIVPVARKGKRRTKKKPPTRSHVGASRSLASPLINSHTTRRKTK